MSTIIGERFRALGTFGVMLVLAVSVLTVLPQRQPPRAIEAVKGVLRPNA